MYFAPQNFGSRTAYVNGAHLVGATGYGQFATMPRTGLLTLLPSTSYASQM